jgi:sigma-B regulation protein RsbU (phosphoserine phosphatase)
MILKFLALIDQQIAHAEAACAGKIQMDLFPAKSIMKAGYSIRGLCLPCEETGGDFFDFFELENGNLIFVLGDVAGHGFSAAMVTIMAKTTIKLLRDIDMLSPEAVVKTLNRVLFDLVRKKKFMTMVIGHIDCSSEQIDMVLAGHLPPLLIRSDGRLEELKNNGFPMGIVKNLPINSMSCRLQPGDALITYTDGIIEALNWKNEQYTYPAWYAFLQQNLPGLSEDSPLESLLVDVFRHKQERGFFDDVSLLLVRKTN